MGGFGTLCLVVAACQLNCQLNSPVKVDCNSKLHFTNAQANCEGPLIRKKWPNIAPGDEAHWHVSTANPKIGGGGAAPPKPFTPLVGMISKVSKHPPFARILLLLVVAHDPH